MTSFMTRRVDRVWGVPNADMPAHALLLYSWPANSLQLHTQQSDWLATFSPSVLAPYTLTEGGQVARPDGTVVAILHQYDRVAPIAERVKIACSRHPAAVTMNAQLP